MGASNQMETLIREPEEFGGTQAACQILLGPESHLLVRFHEI